MMKFIAHGNHSNQSGAALITALVFLVVMTMLALSAMNTNTLEEKMAANSQEFNRVFQAADTAAEAGMADSNSVNTQLAYTDFTYTKNINLDTGDGYAISSSASSVFLEQAPPARSATASEQEYSHFHFGINGTGSISGSGLAGASKPGLYVIASKIDLAL